jgi:hypothetical protein
MSLPFSFQLNASTAMAGGTVTGSAPPPTHILGAVDGVAAIAVVAVAVAVAMATRDRTKRPMSP